MQIPVGCYKKVKKKKKNNIDFIKFPHYHEKAHLFFGRNTKVSYFDLKAV